jgi:hypothetical protein
MPNLSVFALICYMILLVVFPAYTQGITEQQAIRRQIVLQGNFISNEEKPQSNRLVSVKVGEPIYYTLVMKHPKEMEVRFPDSTYQYAPFEFIKKIYFPTRTEKGFSTDSAVYQFSTFELDSIQKLNLPIYVLINGDTTLIYTDLDSVAITPLLVTIPDTTRIISNTQYNPVKQVLNYPYLLIGVGGFVVLLLVLYFIFGERIRKAYTLRRLKRGYEKFVFQFERYLHGTLDNKLAEKGLVLWKSYLENLQEIPYTTYTSKEIEEKINNKDLTHSLKNIDRAIYGNMIDEATKQSLNFLFQYAQSAYQLKIEEVRNA